MSEENNLEGLDIDKINDMIVKIVSIFNRFDATDNEAANVIANLLLQIAKRCEKKTDMYNIIDSMANNAKIQIGKMN